MNKAYNMDCLEAMRQMPDKAFDLAVVDPPYGDGNASIGGHEIDKIYFDKQEERFKKHTQQINMFVDCGVQFEEMKPFAT